MSVRPATLFAFLFSAAAVAAAAGCEFIASVDRADIPQPDAGTTTTSTGGAGGAGGTGTTGGMGGKGGMGAMGGGGMGGMGGTGGAGGAECAMASDCGIDTTCKKFSCSMGVCDSMDTSMGTACTEMNGKKCDGMGTCVECLIDADCTGQDTCDAQHNCSPPGCSNTMLDGMETDTDCGGPMCSDCPDGKMCLVAGDCQSGVCSTTCQAPTCTDSVANGMETDKDCGGTCPAKCMDGLKCMVPGDCESGVCNAGICAAPACNDTVKNGMETDVDCGGPTCPKCADDKDCASDTDCTSAICDGSVCGLNGCTLATATDLTGMAATTVTFTFPAYTPKCLKVDAGTVVTFDGDFTMHPLQGGKVVMGAKVQNATNPFNPVTNTGLTKDFTLAVAGRYAFYCEMHATSGMNGVVFVQ